MKIMRVVELNLIADKERLEYKAAAVRVRKNLQEVKNISQKLRLEINENRKQWD